MPGWIWARVFITCHMTGWLVLDLAVHDPSRALQAPSLPPPSSHSLWQLPVTMPVVLLYLSTSLVTLVMPQNTIT
jgi:hypothetical protein